MGRWFYVFVVVLLMYGNYSVAIIREVFWHKYAKIPRHTSKNAITEGDFKCIFARNCEVTEQLRCM